MKDCERRPDGMPVDPEIRRLRRMLWLTFARQPYMDDGEASDGLIDYMRDSLDEIEAKLNKRKLENFNALQDMVRKQYDGEVMRAKNEELPHPEPWADLLPYQRLDLLQKEIKRRDEL